MRREININELKEIQVNILNHIDEYCKANNIRYSIGYGTLLGAVRHKGYIPWDDDLDIVMPYPDYQRFLKEFHSADYLKVQDMRSDETYRFPFAKVIDTRTVLIEHTITSGVYVDIFPVVGFPKAEEFESFVEEYHKYYMQMRSVTKRKNASFSHKVFFPINKLFKPSRDKVMQKIEAIYSRYDFDKVSHAGVIPNHYKKRRYIPAEVFRKYSTQEFESRQYPALENYDAYLTGTYGDYMTLPPEDKRHSEHVFTAYWKD